MRSTFRGPNFGDVVQEKLPEAYCELPLNKRCLAPAGLISVAGGLPSALHGGAGRGTAQSHTPRARAASMASASAESFMKASGMELQGLHDTHTDPSHASAPLCGGQEVTTASSNGMTTPAWAFLARSVWRGFRSWFPASPHCI